MNHNPTTERMVHVLTILADDALHWMKAKDIGVALGTPSRPLNINTALSCAKIALFVETSGISGQYYYRITGLGRSFLEAYREREAAP